MRVYLPATMTTLAELARTRTAGPPPLVAYAVTPALREWYVEGDLEELEYAAMSAAARQSLRLLADDELAPRRRVVVAADVADAHVTPAGSLGRDAGAVEIGAEVRLDAVVSAHVDDAAAETDVAAAVRALPAADAGDTDAEFAVDGAEAHELAWYAVQEIADLVDR